jgi:hypothetical protein
LQEQQAIAHLSGQIEIVRDQDDGERSRAIQAAQEADALGLMTEIEMRSGLVQNEQ